MKMCLVYLYIGRNVELMDVESVCLSLLIYLYTVEREAGCACLRLSLSSLIYVIWFLVSILEFL